MGVGEFKISERELEIRRYKEALARKNQLSYTTTTTTNNGGIWKMAIVVIGFGLLVGCSVGIAYLIGQNSGKSKNTYCKC